jgi:hypothetical protein
MEKAINAIELGEYTNYSQAEREFKIKRIAISRKY